MRAIITAALNEIVALAETNEDLQQAVEGFVRINEDGTNRGSFVEGRTDIVSTRTLICDELEWVEVPHEDLAPGVAFAPCTYFRTEIPSGMTARTGMLLFGELTEEQLANLMVREGKHTHPEHNPRGLEMVLPWEGPLAETTVAHAILGPDFKKRTENKILWTWYPGQLTAETSSDHLEALEVLETQGASALSAEQRELLAPLAVKLQLG